MNQVADPVDVDFGLYQGDRASCPVEATLDAIGGRWKVLILHELFVRTRRFGELHRGLHGITQKMLTQQLRGMDRDGLVHRESICRFRLRLSIHLLGWGGLCSLC